MYRDSFLHIPKNEIENITQIKNDLTQIIVDDFNETETSIEFFKETDTELVIPRYYYQSNIENRSDTGKLINITSHVKFRNDNQKESSDFMIENNSGLVRCPPGFGKTVISIHSICKLNRRALILVDQLNLVEQWTDRFIEHSSITEKDIDHLEDFDNHNSLITITTIQNILAKIRKNEKSTILSMKESHYGIVIFDEVHTLIGPEKFTLVCGVIFADKMFGLSATPFRDFERKKIIDYWLSPNHFNYGIYNLIPKISTIIFRSNIPFKTQKWIYWGNSFNSNKYYKSLFKHTDFLNMLSSIINKLFIQKRHILLLVGGIKNKFLDDIKNILVESHKIKETEISIYIGGKNKDEVKKQIVLSNYSMAYKGLDEPSLDTVILLTSTISAIYIEQSIGRILRIYKNKLDPLVIDFCDLSYKDLKDSYNIRRQLYESLNFIIQ